MNTVNTEDRTDEQTARSIFRAWLEHLGWDAEQIAVAEAEPVHATDCELTADGWDCRDGDDRSLHPLHDATDESAELITFTLDALAGRLLPEGGEERTEWRINAENLSPQLVAPDESVFGMLAELRRFHRGRTWLESRTVRDFPNGYVLAGPWAEVAE